MVQSAVQILIAGRCLRDEKLSLGGRDVKICKVEAGVVGARARVEAKNLLAAVGPLPFCTPRKWPRIRLRAVAAGIAA